MLPSHSKQRVSPAMEAGLQATQGSEDPAKPKDKARRRNRVIHSCLECRRRKMKCDRGDPCENCRSFNQQCVYVTSANSDAEFRRKLSQMKDAKDALDGALGKNTENDPSRLQPTPDGQTRKRSRPPPTTLHEDSDDTGEDGETQYLEPTPLAVQDAAYADDIDDDVDDLGFRIGRMQLAERIGGLYRPRIADEIMSSLQYSTKGGSPSAPPPVPPAPEDFLTPGALFTAPSIGLIMGPSSPNQPLAGFIPPRNVADRLLERYWNVVHPVARIVHRPTFAQRYETLWELVDSESEVTPSLAAIVSSVLFSAVVSMSDVQVLEACHTSREELKSHLQRGTEASLSKAQLLRSTKTETLQSFVAYLMAMCVGEISRSHSVLTGMAIRLAECMGLHRDPLEYGFEGAECQVRRLIWYQICYLDLKTSEVQGPRPFIYRDGYTTQIPLDISSPWPQRTGTPPTWNDLVFSNIRFECQEMQRQCYSLRNRLDLKKISLAKAISKVEAFRIEMDAKYGSLLNVPNPSRMQRMASVVMKMMISLQYILFLHRYMNSVTYRMPDRMRQIVLTKGTEALEAAVELESSEDFRLWSWYSPAYQQYHTALLLLVEVWAYPLRKEADRLWRCFDFIFAEPLANLPSLQTVSGFAPTRQETVAHRDMKARYLLTMVCQRMREYQKAKGLKLPSSFKESMILITPQKVGDSSNPRMPLNYAHGEPEVGQRGPKPASVSLIDPALREDGMGKSMDRMRAASSDTFDQHAIVQAAHTMGNTTSTWSSESGDFSPWVMDDGRFSGYQQDDITSTPGGVNNIIPANFYPQPQPQMHDIDPQMLEIDWTLWDTIFPPQVNDGDLDISDSFDDYLH